MGNDGVTEVPLLYFFIAGFALQGLIILILLFLIFRKYKRI